MLKLKRKMLLQLAVCCVIIVQFDGCSFDFTKHEVESTGVIDSDDPNIQYMGRFDFTNPKKVAFDWAGVSVKARFEGSSCSLRLADHKNDTLLLLTIARRGC